MVPATRISLVRHSGRRAVLAMGIEPKPTRSAKKNRRRKPREEIVDYVVAIEDWDWGCSFSLNSDVSPSMP